MPGPNDRALGAALRRLDDLSKIETAQQREVLSLLKALQADLVGAIAQASPTRQTDLRELKREADRLIASAYRGIRGQQKAGAEEVAKTQRTSAGSMVSAALELEVKPLPTLSEGQLRALINKEVVLGSSSRAWWNQQDANLRAKFAQAMQLGFTQGEGIEALTRRVVGTRAGGFTDGIMQIPRVQAKALVRSSIASIANQASLDAFGEMSDVIGGIVWITAQDDRVTKICRALEGKRWSLKGYEPIGHDMAFPGPTAHWACFTGEVRVASPSQASLIYRRAYSGELVTIQTDNGRRVTATPNHPILTERGWIAIGCLNSGDNLICKQGYGGGPAHIRPHNQGPATTFQELVDAASKFGRMVSIKVPIATPDFHGDGINQEVCEIWTHSELRLVRYASKAQFIRDSDFQIRDLDGSYRLTLFGHLHKALAGMRPAPRSCMGGVSAGLFAASPSCMELAASGSRRSGGHAPTAERRQRNAELLGYESRSELIGDVERDRVRAVFRRMAVSVFVHNLETESGWYLADGIVSHNCRSTQAPIIVEEVADVKTKLVDGRRRLGALNPELEET